jgi:hypothetical protein
MRSSLYATERITIRHEWQAIKGPAFRGLEAGGWRLEAGGWRLEAGGWRLEA